MGVYDLIIIYEYHLFNHSRRMSDTYKQESMILRINGYNHL